MGKAQEKREAAEKAAAKKAEKDAKKAALKEARAAKKALKAQVDPGVPLCRGGFTSLHSNASSPGMMDVIFEAVRTPHRSRRPSRRRRSPCRRNPRNRTNMSGPTRPKRRWTMLYEDMRLYPIRWKGGA
jgi:DNA-binding GntR family transcriptional regulator